MAIRSARQMSKRFEGVFSLLLTPFHPDGRVDWEAYDRYVAWQLAQHPHGLFGVCGSSEMKWLTFAERLELAERAVKLAGDVPVVVTGNLEQNPAKHLEEALRMADTGAAAIVLVPPSGMGADQNRLGEYFAQLADRLPCPVILYEWPMADAYLVDAEVYGRLANNHNVWGIKDTTCTVHGIQAKIKAAPDSIVYQANHPFMLEAIRMGAKGIMAITTAACADKVIGFWRSAVADEADAAERHYELVVLDSMLIHNGAYPASAKLIARHRGMDIGLTCRNPAKLPPETSKAVSMWCEAGYAVMAR